MDVNSNIIINNLEVCTHTYVYITLLLAFKINVMC